jgi:hypothetical protein
VPEPRPLTAALREALEQVLGGPCVLVRPLSRRDGFAVVREERGEAGNGYEQELVPRVENETAVPALSVSAPSIDGAERVREVCVRLLGLLHATQISTALVNLDAARAAASNNRPICSKPCVLGRRASRVKCSPMHYSGLRRFRTVASAAPLEFKTQWNRHEAEE